MTKNSVGFSYLRLNAEKYFHMNSPVKFSQIGQKLGVEHGQRMTMVRNAKSICLPCALKTD